MSWVTAGARRGRRRPAWRGAGGAWLARVRRAVERGRRAPGREAVRAKRHKRFEQFVKRANESAAGAARRYPQGRALEVIGRLGAAAEHAIAREWFDELAAR